MYNPCDDCILKVNCTEVCLPKMNYKTLIMNAIATTRAQLGNPAYSKHHMNFLTMLRTTNRDETYIIHRAREALGEFQHQG